VVLPDPIAKLSFSSKLAFFLQIHHRFMHLHFAIELSLIADFTEITFEGLMTFLI